MERNFQFGGNVANVENHGDGNRTTIVQGSSRRPEVPYELQRVRRSVLNSESMQTIAAIATIVGVLQAILVGTSGTIRARLTSVDVSHPSVFPLVFVSTFFIAFGLLIAIWICHDQLRRGLPIVTRWPFRSLVPESSGRRYVRADIVVPCLQCPTGAASEAVVRKIVTGTDEEGHKTREEYCICRRNPRHRYPFDPTGVAIHDVEHSTSD